jgi:tripartite-type tricarboxylate transporter receptor subunit TctC
VRARWVREIFCTAIAFGAAAAACAQTAQSYPNRPVRVVVPFPAGGGLDVVIRPVNEKLTAALGQPFVVDVRPGADGQIGTQAVARSPADGYTLLASSTGPMVINPVLNPVLGLPTSYDPIGDFAPITQLVAQSMCLLVHPSLPVRSAGELAAFAKARPGQLNYASAGIGNATHLAAEMFKAATGTNIVHIPYKGSAIAQVDLVSGRVHMMIMSIPVMLPHIKSGRLRALAVGADHRLKVLPDVPTMREAGIAGFNASSWYGLFAPAGTPKDIVAKLNSEAVKALRNRELETYLASQGSEAVGGTIDEFAAHMKRELSKWRQAVADAGIKPEAK